MNPRREQVSVGIPFAVLLFCGALFSFHDCPAQAADRPSLSVHVYSKETEKPLFGVTVTMRDQHYLTGSPGIYRTRRQKTGRAGIVTFTSADFDTYTFKLRSGGYQSYLEDKSWNWRTANNNPAYLEVRIDVSVDGFESKSEDMVIDSSGEVLTLYLASTDPGPHPTVKRKPIVQEIIDPHTNKSTGTSRPSLSVHVYSKEMEKPLFGVTVTMRDQHYLTGSPGIYRTRRQKTGRAGIVTFTSADFDTYTFKLRSGGYQSYLEDKSWNWRTANNNPAYLEVRIDVSVDGFESRSLFVEINRPNAKITLYLNKVESTTSRRSSVVREPTGTKNNVLHIETSRLSVRSNVPWSSPTDIPASAPLAIPTGDSDSLPRMSALYCTQCGMLLPENANFCPACGTRISVVNSNRKSDGEINQAPIPRKTLIRQAVRARIESLLLSHSTEEYSRISADEDCLIIGKYKVPYRIIPTNEDWKRMVAVAPDGLYLEFEFYGDPAAMGVPWLPKNGTIAVDFSGKNKEGTVIFGVPGPVSRMENSEWGIKKHNDLFTCIAYLKEEINEDEVVQRIFDGNYLRFQGWPRRGIQQYREPIVNTLGMEMMWIPPGSFVMGSPMNEQGRETFEGPQHSVQLTNGFYLGANEVTLKQWRKIMGNIPRHMTVNKKDLVDDMPVEGIAWNAARDFCQKLSQKEGRKYRLPTEAEWEYAARGGPRSQGFKYAGSNTIDLVAWYAGNSGGKPHPIGSKMSNECGLYDMSGSVCEWCQDWFDKSYYSTGPSQDPQGPLSGSMRVIRGGAWSYPAKNIRCAERRAAMRGTGTLAGDGWGFRVLLESE